ncbi:hypothetical protein A0256_15475 [Mucilaginibacter sp. PAMC 26640]|nr:hypothetical protein A0256_15475 [Mucilaginibacter sp. PAMC 26640]
MEEGSGINEEEALYGYELLHFVKLSKNWNRDKKIARILRSYEKAGYQTLDDKFDALIGDLNKNDDKPEPLGKGRFSTGRSGRGGRKVIAESALQYLTVLGESGFQLCLPRVYRVSVKKWWEIQLGGFELYPAAFLFYSLQYSETDFLQRVGQEYAYSEAIRPSLSLIIQQLIAGYHDAPVYYRDSTLIFLSNAIIAIDPQIWEPGFVQFWHHYKQEGLLFDADHRRENFLKFFEAGIKYVDQNETIQMIVKDAITQVIAGKGDQAITYLYLLNQNKNFKNFSVEFSADIDELIVEVIKRLRENKEDAIYALGNIHKRLKSEHQVLLAQALADFDYSQIKNGNSWSIFLYFISADSNLQERLKQSIINSGLAFYTGIEGHTASFGGTNYVIPIHRLTAGEIRKNGLIWSEVEIIALYKQLKEKAAPLERYMDKDQMMFSFTEVLEEMQWFLDRYKEELKNQPDFIEQFATITRYYQDNRNYKELESGLISNDHSTVVWSLAELSTAVYTGIATVKQLSLVVYKVLMQSDPALEASIDYLAAWMDKLMKRPELSVLHPLLSDILKQYRENPLLNYDVAFIQEKFIRIANRLSRNKLADEHTKWWLDEANQSEYNNIKQFVKTIQLNEESEE